MERIQNTLEEPTHPTSEDVEKLLKRLNVVLELNETLKTSLALATKGILDLSDTTSNQLKIVLDFTSAFAKDVDLGNGVIIPNAKKLIESTQLQVQGILDSIPNEFSALKEKLEAEFDKFIAENTHFINEFKITFVEELKEINSNLENNYNNKTQAVDNLIETTNTQLREIKAQIDAKIEELNALDIPQELQKIKDEVRQEFDRLKSEQNEALQQAQEQVDTKLDEVTTNLEQTQEKIKQTLQDTQERIDTKLESFKGFDYIEAVPPTKAINPSKDNALYLDTLSGILWICRDKTEGSNVWEEFLKAQGNGFYGIEERDPSASENPKDEKALWLNYKSFEVFICIDNTPNKNIWVGNKNGSAGGIVSDLFPPKPPTAESEIQDIYIDSRSGKFYFYLEDLAKYLPVLDFNKPYTIEGKTYYYLTRKPSLTAQSLVAEQKTDTDVIPAHSGLPALEACNLEGRIYLAKYKAFFIDDVEVTNENVAELKQQHKDFLTKRVVREPLRWFFCYKKDNSFELKEVYRINEAYGESEPPEHIATPLLVSGESDENTSGGSIDDNLLPQPSFRENDLYFRIKSKVFYVFLSNKWVRLGKQNDLAYPGSGGSTEDNSGDYYEDLENIEFSSDEEKIDYMVERRLINPWLCEKLDLIMPSSEESRWFELDANWSQGTKYAYFLELEEPFGDDFYYRNVLMSLHINNTADAVRTYYGTDLESKGNIVARNLKDEDLGGYFEVEKKQVLNHVSNTGYYVYNRGYWSGGYAEPNYGRRDCSNVHMGGSGNTSYYYMSYSFNEIKGVKKGALVYAYPFTKPLAPSASESLVFNTHKGSATFLYSALNYGKVGHEYNMGGKNSFRARVLAKKRVIK
ncbi:apolipoprotein A1/A4/E domain-containing protein [Helicobacter sp. WB40]|uniref:apolipoprotein A1/A4/E domain-containing protein n=1 Tax=Helicobacter sp. WB40 TaxID=3004130 RepID=UPI0022EC1108|nr:apolipoprotein A1/A4/E domain-containing protein [Helicobacter sp. WB40]MDA3967372.1 apolipoprotein A1/A4/E family protein [Helicobacter sp. WB40]